MVYALRCPEQGLLEAELQSFYTSLAQNQRLPAGTLYYFVLLSKVRQAPFSSETFALMTQDTWTQEASLSCLGALGLDSCGRAGRFGPAAGLTTPGKAAADAPHHTAPVLLRPFEARWNFHTHQ